MKPTWLDVVSVALLATGLAAGVWQHLPVAAPWALAFAVYVVARTGRDAYRSWREEHRHQRVWHQTETQALHADIEALAKLVAEVKAERERMLAAYASLEADVRAIQGQSSMQQGFGLPPLNFGPSMGPTRGGG